MRGSDAPATRFREPVRVWISSRDRRASVATPFGHISLSATSADERRCRAGPIRKSSWRIELNTRQMCRIDVNQARLGVTPARLASAWEHRTAHMDRLDSTDGDSPMAALPSCAAVHVARTRSPRFIDAIPLHPRRVGAPARRGFCDRHRRGVPLPCAGAVPACAHSMGGRGAGVRLRIT